jgi:hypothetical protein
VAEVAVLMSPLEKGLIVAAFIVLFLALNVIVDDWRTDDRKDKK